MGLQYNVGSIGMGRVLSELTNVCVTNWQSNNDWFFIFHCNNWKNLIQTDCNLSWKYEFRKYFPMISVLAYNVWNITRVRQASHQSQWSTIKSHFWLVLHLKLNDYWRILWNFLHPFWLDGCNAMQWCITRLVTSRGWQNRKIRQTLLLCA